MMYRYHFDDALRGEEAVFIICRTWLTEALAIMGERAPAEELLNCIGPLGLIAEEWDRKWVCALRNYPQAYSHFGLINAICAPEGSN